MKPKFKIALQYVVKNSGHQIAAESIQQTLHKFYPDVETKCMDFFSLYRQFMGKTGKYSYNLILKNFPQIWKYSYDNPFIFYAFSNLRKNLNLLGIKKIINFVNSFHPQLMIFTQAVPCGICAQAKKIGVLNIPLIAVTTDFNIHSYWIYPEVDKYIVSTEQAKQKLLKYKIKEEKIIVSGIPVRPEFLTFQDKKLARELISLSSDKFTVLIMGGTEGWGKIEKLLSFLLKRQLNIQVIIVCGHNKNLYALLKRNFPDNKNLKIVGYTQQVSLFMDASDIIITKPGGMTCSECLIKNLPMILFNTLPGQEERNLTYLTNKQVAKQAKNVKQVADLVEFFYLHPQELVKLKENIKKISHPEANLQIINLVKYYKEDYDKRVS